MEYSINYYEVLGLKPGASMAEVKAAYKRLALKWHPDCHVNDNPLEKKNAEEMFKMINEAYNAILNGRGSSYGTYESQENKADGFDHQADGMENRDQGCPESGQADGDYGDRVFYIVSAILLLLVGLAIVFGIIMLVARVWWLFKLGFIVILIMGLIRLCKALFV